MLIDGHQLLQLIQRFFFNIIAVCLTCRLIFHSIKDRSAGSKIHRIELIHLSLLESRVEAGYTHPQVFSIHGHQRLGTVYFGAIFPAAGKRCTAHCKHKTISRGFTHNRFHFNPSSRII